MGRKSLVDAEDIKYVVSALIDYWPLTIRQVYYRLVAEGSIKNANNYYKAVCRQLTILRENEIIPWEAIEDRSRQLSYKRGASDVAEHLYKIVFPLIENYERCYIKNQDYYVEIWVEKDALAAVFIQRSLRYCVQILPCRGYNSTTHINQFLDRADKKIMDDKRPVILYFGDFDPTGYDIFEFYKRKLWGQYERGEIELRRVALNYEQVVEWDLPLNPEQCKVTDPRYKKFVSKFGKVAVELDAIHPAQLQELFASALENYFDMGKFAEQERIERAELKHIGKNMDIVKQLLINLLVKRK